MDDTAVVIRRILDDRLNRVVFREVPEACLVGGFIRDAFLGGVSGDRDFAVKGDPEEIACRIKGFVGGTIVKLKDGATVRIALRGGMSLDFSRYGGGISDDLLRRDFTINAIAFSVETGLYDPLGGVRDLKRRCIRMIREENLVDDPVRMLRAYRFVGELDGYVDAATRGAIKRHKGLLERSAPERITLEFFKLLQSRACPRALKEAFEVSVGRAIVPLKNKELNAVMQKMVEVIRNLEEAPEDFRRRLDRGVSQGLTLRGLVLLDVLLGGVAVESTRLRLSGRLMRRVARFRGCREDVLGREGVDDGDLFDCFEALGCSVLEAVLVQGRPDLYEKARRYLAVCDRPLLNGEDVRRLAPGVEGPEVGRLLYEAKKAQFAGRIRSREEAAAFLRRLSGAEPR